jgi:hypothetical protein
MRSGPARDIAADEEYMMCSLRSFVGVSPGTGTDRQAPGRHRALLVLAIAVTLLDRDASAQARRYPLESTTGLRLVNVTAEPATLQGKKGLRITGSEEVGRVLSA